MECILPVLLFDFRRVILASVTLASKSSGDRMVGRSVAWPRIYDSLRCNRNIISRNISTV